jgi:hypothetical protein
MRDDLTGATMSTNDAGFAATWARIVAESKASMSAWVAMLREQGIKAAHPDDGWVDRNKNTVHFAYPNFGGDHSVKEGSLIALGRPDKWRIVRITGCRDSILGSMRWWSFEEVPGAGNTEGGDKP